MSGTNDGQRGAHEAARPNTETQDLSALRRGVAAPEDRVPQPKRKFATRVLLPVGAVAVFLGLLAWAGRDLIGRTVDVRVIPVVSKKLAGMPGPGVTTQAAGWIEPDPFPVHVTALTEGVVSEVLVLDGERVEKDQVVARLVPDDARIALAKAEANLEIARRAVEIADARAAGAGSAFDQAIERRRESGVAAAEHAMAVADAKSAEQEHLAEVARAAQAAEVLDRAERDLRAGAVAEIEVVKMRREAEAMKLAAAAAEARAAAAASKVTASEASLRAAEAGATHRIEETAERRVSIAEAAKARAELAVAEADRDEAALRVARLEIRAPSAGVVIHRQVEPGLMVPAKGPNEMTSHILSLYDPAKLQVRTDVPLADAGKIGVGTKARIVVEVLPDRVFEGEVSRLVNIADIQKNTIQFKVRIKDPGAELKPDMLARVQFVTAPKGAAGGEAEDVRVFAPERLLLADEDGDEVVWVVNTAQGRAERRVVERGSFRTDGWVEVRSGLRLGDALIDSGPDTLEQGIKVRVLGESEAKR